MAKNARDLDSHGEDSSTISQFRQISLLNVEGKLSSVSVKNNLIDTSVQKTEIGGFSGCLEHAKIIWHHVQTAKKEKKDLHVVFLDLANAFGSVPHEILWTPLNFFHVPEGRTKRMEIKSSKSCHISIVKGRLANERFYIGWEPKSTILEKSIKSLGRWYNAAFKDEE